MLVRELIDTLRAVDGSLPVVRHPLKGECYGGGMQPITSIGTGSMIIGPGGNKDKVGVVLIE